MGLTGGIGSGKSEVARRLAAQGAAVIDADLIAREVVAPGTPGLAEVAEAFGATGAIFLKGTVSPYNPKTLRASAGSLFRVPYLHGVDAELVRAAGGGPVADVGCGPGHVTAHLHDLGLDAFGIDQSPVMIDVAWRDHPGLRFEVGSMTDLPLAIAGLIAFWSLVHVPGHALPGVLGQFRRVLRPGGVLLLGFMSRTPRR